MDEIQRKLLEEVSGLHEIPTGAFNIRANGISIGREVTTNIEIATKKDKPGIDIYVKPGTKGESVHIPVLLTATGLKDLVYNDFYIGEGAEVTIIAGCGIHNGGKEQSQHDGIHSFHIGKNARVSYVEKHYGEGQGDGDRVMNPTTLVEIEEDGYMEMDTLQIKGVTDTKRVTKATLKDRATLIIHEKIMTDGSERAETDFTVDLNGVDSSANVVSRSVAKENSQQLFKSRINGNNKCAGHTECDAIIMDKGSVRAVPELTANNVEASLIHEAAIGKIAGDQLIKLMTLGLTEQQAEEQIVSGFLR